MWEGQQKKVGVVIVQNFEPFPQFGDFHSKYVHKSQIHVAVAVKLQLLNSGDCATTFRPVIPTAHG